MICEKCLKRELAQSNKHINRAYKEKDYSAVFEAACYQDFLQWVLSEDDCHKSLSRLADKR